MMQERNDIPDIRLPIGGWGWMHREYVIEERKATNPMVWVTAMNNTRNCTDEIVKKISFSPDIV